MKDWVVQNYGLFDENLYPAYCEDVDYIMRIFHAPFKKISSLSRIHLHGDNQPMNIMFMVAKLKKQPLN